MYADVFDVKTGSLNWSQGRAPQDVGYYRAANNSTPLVLKLDDFEDSDAMINFKYWISEPDGNMSIKYSDMELLTVGQSTSMDDKVHLLDGTFKCSDFSHSVCPKEIHFLPMHESMETVVGITDVDVKPITSVLEVERKKFIISSSENNFTNWISVRVPEEHIYVSQEGKLIINGPLNSTVSVFSDWINATNKELKLRIEW